MNRTLQIGDQNLGLFPIECGWDNPNCLGGYNTILSATDAANEPLRSRWGYDIAPPIQPLAVTNSRFIENGPPAVDCNCLSGTAVLGPDGVCRCESAANPDSSKGAVSGSISQSQTVSVGGVEISRNLLIGGALLAAILLMNGDK